MRKFCGFLLFTLLFTSVPLIAGGEPKRLGNPPMRVDLDLTQFNDMMAYSGLFNVYNDPEVYVGKIIKLKGQFDCSEEDESGRRFYAVVLTDASACCAIGLDFVLKDDYVYPKDYPNIGANITVVGRFEMYKEGEDIFAHLVDADIM